MILLTIDTSTNACSVALTREEELVAEALINVSGRQSTRVMETVDAVLGSAGMALADVDGFGVALGPGSFTGVRIGVATVKGLALATGKPVAGFSSLAMLAMNVPCAGIPVCPLFDARKKEVYAGTYSWRNGSGPEPLIPDCVMSPDRYLERIEGQAIFLGEGALVYRALIEDRLGARAEFAPFPCHQPSAARGAYLALQAFRRNDTIPLQAIAPLYIRPSEAELAKMSKVRL